MASKRKSKPVNKSPTSVSDEDIKRLHECLPCRNKQLSLLLSLFGQTNLPTYPSLFIYGHSATGKSLTVTSVLRTLELPNAVINCVECQTQRSLCESILNQIAEVEACSENNYDVFSRCDNMNDFVRLLKGLVKDKDLEAQTIYIVLDKAERLRNMEGNVLPAFLRLAELSRCNVCVILISQISWEKFRCGTGFLEPLVVHFPDYTKDELLTIVSQDCPSDYPVEFYSSYANLLMSVFYMACRDLNEIRHLAKLNFPKYIEPITKGEITSQEIHKLWRNIEPHLKKALQMVYLREVTSAQWEDYQQAESTCSSQPAMLSSRAFVELPFYSKFLLIAAYLASYNPVKSDRRFFSKHHGKVQKSKFARKKETSHQLLGPKPFPLDRLMAIFYSIVDARVAPTANVFSQISSLVTLRLLSCVGHDDQLDTPKYKCTVSLDFIRGISRTVNFDIVRYLYDFAM